MSPSSLTCRFCGAPLRTTFLDLGSSPLCQTHIAADQLQPMEPFYPLHAYVCEACFLVQLRSTWHLTRSSPSTPTFRRFSASWVEHARRYVEHVARRFALSSSPPVIEIASNDGYLLQHFVAEVSRSWASSLPPTSPRGRSPRGFRRGPAFFGSRTAEAIAAGAWLCGPATRQQRPRARAGPQ